MPEVVFLDSSVLLNLLDVPRKNSDRETITDEFRRLVQSKATLIIPVAAVIEVGNHIAQLPGDPRWTCGQRFAELLRQSADRRAPWVVSGGAWDEPFLRRVVDGHNRVPSLTDLCTAGVGSGDASILHEVERYRSRSDVPSAQPIRLWTLDTALAAHG